MSSVDDRLVNMRFDNSAFMRGISTTLSALSRLKQSLNIAPSRGGLGQTQAQLADLQGAANRFNMNGMSSSVEGVSARFLALSTIAITALSNITNRAVDAGTNMANALTLDPLKSGFEEYELKMGSIQTILANTARHGTTLEEVVQNLDELNEYADKTIYNFGDMTKNIGLFTNAGLKVEEATSMIKGFSNEAAASGTNAQGAASAAYQLSQALSAGTIRLMDWRSLQNVGMGNKNMQLALVEIAEAMGVFNEVATDAELIQEDFNGSLETGWLSAEVMSNYLKIMAGDMTEAEQSALGLDAAMIESLGKQQKMAEDSATKVRTLTQLMGTIKESVGSGWASTWDMIFGDFNEATDLFTGVYNAIGGMVDKTTKARNDLIFGWDELGGREALLEGLRNTFDGFFYVLSTIGRAFRDIFPATTVDQLVSFTERFRDFSKTLKMGEETAVNLRRTFRGVFAVFSIAWQILSGFAGVFFDLLGLVSDGTGGFLSFTGSIGDFIVALDIALKEGGLLNGFFEGLTAVLKAPIQLLGAVAGFIGKIFTGFDAGAGDQMVQTFNNAGDRLASLSVIGDRVSAVLAKVRDFAIEVGEKIGEAFGAIGEILGNAITPETFGQLLDVINVGLFGALVLMLKNFLGGDFSLDLTGGLLDGVTETLSATTDTLKSMQQQIKADTLMKIAIALALLTASILALSFVDPEKLAYGLGGLSVAFGVMQVALLALSKYIGYLGMLKLPFIVASMIGLAAAMLIMVGAIKLMSMMSWEEIGRGLSGIAGAMLIMVAAAIPLSKNSGGIVRAGLAILILATAMNVMAVAVKAFAGMNWEEIGRGLAGVAGTLVAVAVGMRLMPKGMVLQAAAILILSQALKQLYRAVESFSGMNWQTMGRGIAGVAGSLAAIAIAMRLMPKGMILQAAAILILSQALGQLYSVAVKFASFDYATMARGLVGITGSLAGIAIAMRLMPKGMVLQAAALVIVAQALQSLSVALDSFAGMTWEEIGKGLVVLGGAMVILAAGLMAMQGSLGASAALMVAALALRVLVPVLQSLGGMEWAEIGKGLAALAAVFVILGIAGLALMPIVPVLVALGAAIALMGAGFALAGVAALAFATAFSMVVAQGMEGVAVAREAFLALIELLPEFMAALGEGLIAFLQVIITAAPKFFEAFVSVMTALLNAIITLTPLIGQAMTAIITTMLQVVSANLPRLVQGGIDLLLALLNGIKNNIGTVTATVAAIIVNFLNALAANIGSIIDAGFNLLVSFLRGIADAVDERIDEVIDAGLDIAEALINGVIDGIEDGMGRVGDAARNLGSAAINGAKGILGINSPSRVFRGFGEYIDEGLALGIDDGADNVVSSVERLGTMAIDTMSSAMDSVRDAAYSEIVIDPTITPVLDLAQLANDASQIGGLLAVNPLSVGGAYSSANVISNAQRRLRDAQVSEESKAAVGRSVTLVQNNTSPKALSEGEIYRQTRNLISTAKGALTI